MPHRQRIGTDNTPRLLAPSDLIGAAVAADLLKIDKSTLTRRIKAGKVPFLVQLDGSGGAFVFDLHDINALANEDNPPR